MKTEKIVAWLHSIIEYTSIDEIRGLFGDAVADAVKILTREEGVSYFDYIREVKKNPIARRVKIEELNKGMDVSGLVIITDADWNRVEKYRKALAILREE
jgi:hypothetical protein